MKCLYCKNPAKADDYICGEEECVRQIARQMTLNASLFEGQGKYIQILQDENFFDRCCKEVGKKVAGEEDTIRAIFLCCAGRLVKNNQPASYNLLVNSESGAGKDYVTERVLKMLPKEEYVKRTRISPTTFTYWHNAKFEPEWTWDKKVCYLEDCSNNLLNHEVFKVMASSGSHATVVIDQRATDIEINGKPVIIVTSASVTPNPEMVRRLCPIKLDESMAQSNLIIRKQVEFVMKGYDEPYDEDLISAQKYLQRVSVRISFTETLALIFYDKPIIVRTHFRRFLDYMMASAAFHQFQRQRDVDGFIIAEAKDYEIAREVFLKLTPYSSLVPLTKDQTRLLKIIEDNFGESLTPVIDIEPKITFMSDKWLRIQLDELAEKKYLQKNMYEEVLSDSDEGRVRLKKYIAYKFIRNEKLILPKWNEIQI